MGDQAGFLGKKGTKTNVFTRFSTVLGSRGSADTVRDTRGFAVKFYTDESADNAFWDFVSLHAEATLHVMRNMSDRGARRGGHVSVYCWLPSTAPCVSSGPINDNSMRTRRCSPQRAGIPE